MSTTLNPGERLDDLQVGGLKLIQRPDAFRFGTDSVLLADFAAPRRDEIAVDLGCGTGAIALLMAGHQARMRVDGVELQPDVADMAGRSVALNGLQSRMRVYCLDMREAWRTLGAGRYSLAVCNPPYGRSGAALESRSEAFRIARHEGELTVIYPAPRAYELMRAMDEAGIAPKRLRTVHGVEGRVPKFVLLEGVKQGGEGLHWLPPLVLRNEDGSFSGEWHRIYGD